MRSSNLFQGLKQALERKPEMNLSPGVYSPDWASVVRGASELLPDSLGGASKYLTNTLGHAGKLDDRNAVQMMSARSLPGLMPFPSRSVYGIGQSYGASGVGDSVRELLDLKGTRPPHFRFQPVSLLSRTLMSYSVPPLESVRTKSRLKT